MTKIIKRLNFSNVIQINLYFYNLYLYHGQYHGHGQCPQSGGCSSDGHRSTTPEQSKRPETELPEHGDQDTQHQTLDQENMR